MVLYDTIESLESLGDQLSIIPKDKYPWWLIPRGSELDKKYLEYINFRISLGASRPENAVMPFIGIIDERGRLLNFDCLNDFMQWQQDRA